MQLHMMLVAPPQDDLPANINVEGYQHFNMTLAVSCNGILAGQLACTMSHLKASHQHACTIHALAGECCLCGRS